MFEEGKKLYLMIFDQDSMLSIFSSAFFIEENRK